MLNLYLLFIPLAPLIASLFTAFPNKYLSDKNYKIGWWIIFAGFVTSLFLLWQTIQNPEPIHLFLFTTPWKILPIVELYIDRLSAVMMALVSGYGTILYRYSIRYLQQDSGLNRYLTLLAIKLSFQLFVVSSADLLILFICWQLLGWFLSLLSHNYAHTPTAQGSFRTFIMLRAGDMAFLAGIVLAYHLYGTVEFTQLFKCAAVDQTRFTLFGTGLEISHVTIITLLIFFGAMCKSAQFPMHMWLPDSLYAPTPIHALLHAGGINSGGFLLTRLAPLYVLSPITLHVVLGIGLVTAILGTGMMLVQNDIKKTLGYSTIGQMGYMMMECGLGAFSMAVFHLIAHGLFKADIFLNCGKGIHEARLHPLQPPTSLSQSAFSVVSWVLAFFLSFLVPLVIMIVVHYVLGISFLDSQGIFILLLFSWVTASQAMLTLFRLKKPLLTNGKMLTWIMLVAMIYFFVADQFTHFLNPDKNVVLAYLRAAELPYHLFITLVILLISSIVISWLFFIYYQQNDKCLVWSRWLNINAYLFFMNRLYLDGVALRLFGILKKIGRMIDRSPIVLIVVILVSLVIAFGQIVGLSVVSLKTVILLLFLALLIPLFPFHGVYVTLMTRAPRALVPLLSVIFPMLGMCVMIWLLPEIPRGLLPVIRVMAVIGAFWGSIKALLQNRVSRLLSYGGLALYSIFWLDLAQVGKMTPHLLLYGWAVILVLGGLFLAWDRLRIRYGDLDLNQIGGLFKPMPYFALCMGLLIMAGVGLPPFSLFFGYLGILLSSSADISFSVVVIITWFIACWYLFKLMQRLLFGPHRTDIYYEDLRPSEITIFVLVIILLVVSNGIQQSWLGTAITKITWNDGGIQWIQ